MDLMGGCDLGQNGIAPCDRKVVVELDPASRIANSERRLGDLNVRVTGGKSKKQWVYCPIGVGGYNNIETFMLLEIMANARENHIKIG